ncbi:MAG: hypothetical protein ABSC95_03085 [Acetobacteraceae bacterium]|jgi:opacity protein-like surface antigen
MKKFLFAALAALSLSLSLGSAYAAQTVQQHNGFSVTPAYSDDALGGA